MFHSSFITRSITGDAQLQVTLMNDGAEIILNVAAGALPKARLDSATFERAIETSFVATIVVDATDEDLPIIYANQAFARLTGYRYPPFQFLKGGLVNPRLSELMEALALQPGLHPSYDKSGWERAFWLYQPARAAEHTVTGAARREVQGRVGRSSKLHRPAKRSTYSLQKCFPVITRPRST